MSKQFVSITINGEVFEASVDLGKSLLEFIREDAGVTGTKYGCGVGECGACTVLVNGTPINSCIYLAIWADGQQVRTVEGLALSDGTLSEVQQAFVDEGAVQCGFCTPGFIMSVTAMKESGITYSDTEIQTELSGHLCRCTGYQKIFNAAKKCAGDGSCEKEHHSCDAEHRE